MKGEDPTQATSIVERLKRHWIAQNLKINPGASDMEIAAFESRYSVVFPSDLRAYFSCVNGMDRDDVDNEMIRFWTLQEVQPLTQGAPNYSDPNYIKSPESLFLFADYSIWAHAYAIRMETVPSKLNEIVIIGHPSPKLLCNSFSEFVDRYLTDKPALH